MTHWHPHVYLHGPKIFLTKFAWGIKEKFSFLQETTPGLLGLLDLLGRWTSAFVLGGFRKLSAWLHVTRICHPQTGLRIFVKDLAENLLECEFSISPNQSLFGTLFILSITSIVRDSIPSSQRGNPQHTSLEVLSRGLIRFTRETIIPFLTFVATKEKLALALFTTFPASTQR